jgi:twitching motility protein PilT
MVMTRAIANLITSDQTHQIPSQLQTGADIGMQLMDQALLEAVEAREADADDAVRFATDKSLFTKLVTDTTILQRVDLTATTN